MTLSEKAHALSSDVARFEMKLMILERCRRVETGPLEQTYRELIQRRRSALQQLSMADRGHATLQ
ncbi:hypothetical protein QQM79_03105 [Marinobacteraceae bacterium S3BR75-40.1]